MITRLLTYAANRLPPVICWGAVALWAATIWWLSSNPVPELPDPAFEIPHLDKIVHFIAFGIGAFGTAWAARRSGLGRGAAQLLSIIAIAAFGAIDEWHQLSTPGRTGGDLFDWLADCAGAIVGTLIALSLFLRFYVDAHPSRSRPPRPATAPGA